MNHNYNHITQAIQPLKYLRLRGTWHAEVVPIGDNLLLEVQGSVKDRCWFAQALTKEGIDARALGDPNKMNVRRFWDWAYLAEDKTNNNLTRLYPNSFKHISSYIDLALSPTLTQEDLEDCVRAITKVHNHYESKISFE